MRSFAPSKLSELLHLPHMAAGVEEGPKRLLLATELLHLPGKPAGVEESALFPIPLATELLHLPGKPNGTNLGNVRPHVV
jgi:hypothetical protein